MAKPELETKSKVIDARLNARQEVDWHLAVCHVNKLDVIYAGLVIDKKMKPDGWMVG